MNNRNVKLWAGELLRLLEVLLGNLIYAAAIQFFVDPANLIMGGATGIALFLDDHTNIPMTTFLMIFNVMMLILGWATMGRKFAFTTIVSTFAYPLFLDVLKRFGGSVVLTDDFFLCAVFGGLGIGIGLGLVFRAGSSTGGMDIPPLIMNKYLKIPVSVGMYLFDIVIILLQAVVSDIRCLMYGIVMLIVYTIVMDKAVMLGSSKTQVKIISHKAKDICAAILSEADRGVTLIKARGGYLENDTEFVMTVITNRELPHVQRLVHSIDPHCFMIVTRVTEVAGNGFTFDRDDHQHPTLPPQELTKYHPDV